MSPRAPPPGAHATLFAGAVLDAAVMLDDLLPHGDELELFSMGIGQLAFQAAEEAHASNRIPKP